MLRVDLSDSARERRERSGPDRQHARASSISSTTDTVNETPRFDTHQGTSAVWIIEAEISFEERLVSECQPIG